MLSYSHMPSPTDFDADSPRRRILSAARTRFEIFGYRRAAVADIARDAGLATGTLYRYFDNKEKLLVAVIREVMAGWLVRAKSLLAEPGSAIERLARLAPASMEYNRQNKLLNYVLNRDTEMILAPLLDKLNDELTSQHIAIMASVVRDGIDEGCLRKVDAERTAFILFLAGHALYDQKRYPYEEVLFLFAEIAMGGLIPR